MLLKNVGKSLPPLYCMKVLYAAGDVSRVEGSRDLLLIRRNEFKDNNCSLDTSDNYH